MGPKDDAADTLLARIDLALGRGRLGAWETRFLQDMQAKIRRDGGVRRLTAKQLSKLEHVLTERAAPVRAFPAHSQGRLRRRSRRWLPGQQGLTLALLIALLLAAGVQQLYQRLDATPSAETQVAAGALSQGSHSGEITGPIRVIDGDTVDVRGERFRLVGLNTPETYEPRCAAELELGTRAKERLMALLAGGPPRLVKVPCACPPGSEGTKRCNHGRSCGVLSVNGVDVAETLVSEGLAVAFHCGAESCPPMPRPWCG